jgi:shikimate dehydrogenase
MSKSKPVACIVGWPVKHSRSPKLHGYWIKKYGLDADYRAEEVAPDAFEAFIANLRRHGYVGCNITIPHKELALSLTAPDARARNVGGANTLWFEGDVLRSTNTDVEGFLHAMDASAPGWDQRTNQALVLGAGGAGRAVIFGLIERAISTIHVVNRSMDKAAVVATHFGPTVKFSPWDAIPDLLRTSNLLVNSTALGMAGQAPLAIDLGPMPSGSVVSDVVYVPLKTPLLMAAEARGFSTSNGLDMLLHQAVRGFELWFGVRPEVTKDQRDMLVQDLLAS